MSATATNTIRKASMATFGTSDSSTINGIGYAGQEAAKEYGPATPTISRRGTNQSSASNTKNYFQGPRDVRHHSKYPLFLRLHGSVLPRLILPLLFMACWSILITCISKYIHPLQVDSTLLTIMGFVVSFGLSFKASTSYSRYLDGMGSWTSVTVHARNMSRLIWIYVKERYEDEENPNQGNTDLLSKVSAIRLILAFAVALKHQLKFEAATDYEDLIPLIDHIPTMASLADQAPLHDDGEGTGSFLGEFLGISFLKANPRHAIHHSKDNLGNMPLEILTCLSAWVEDASANGSLSNGIAHANLSGGIAALTEDLTQAQRILHNPVPVAFTISIAQITWVYLLLLPFQLYKYMGWITIPSTIFATYITLGLAAIGNELEDPFGNDVNDLPLETYCDDLRRDFDLLMSTPPPRPQNYLRSPQNHVLHPLSTASLMTWEQRPTWEIRNMLRAMAGCSDSQAERFRKRSLHDDAVYQKYKAENDEKRARKEREEKAAAKHDHGEADESAQQRGALKNAKIGVLGAGTEVAVDSANVHDSFDGPGGI